MDERFKPCERLEIPVSKQKRLRQKPPDCLHLMILEVDLHLRVLKREEDY